MPPPVNYRSHGEFFYKHLLHSFYYNNGFVGNIPAPIQLQTLLLQFQIRHPEDAQKEQRQIILRRHGNLIHFYRQPTALHLHACIVVLLVDYFPSL